MCVFMALALVAHGFATISGRDSGEGLLKGEIEEILTTDEARRDYEDLQEEGGFQIPGTDIRIGGGATDQSFDEFVENTSSRLSEVLYEGGPDEADELLQALNVERAGDSPLNFFQQVEDDDGLLDIFFEDDERDPLAFFASDEAPLEDEFSEIFDRAGDDDGLGTLDAHEAVNRLRWTFGLLALASAVALGLLVTGGGARLLAPATVAAATSFPFAVLAFLLYVILRPDDELSLGSLFSLIDISIGDVLRDYMIVFGVSCLAVIAGMSGRLWARSGPAVCSSAPFRAAGKRMSRPVAAKGARIDPRRGGRRVRTDARVRVRWRG